MTRKTGCVLVVINSHLSLCCRQVGNYMAQEAICRMAAAPPHLTKSHVQ